MQDPGKTLPFTLEHELEGKRIVYHCILEQNQAVSYFSICFVLFHFLL